MAATEDGGVADGGSRTTRSRSGVGVVRLDRRARPAGCAGRSRSSTVRPPGRGRTLPARSRQTADARKYEIGRAGLPGPPSPAQPAYLVRRAVRDREAAPRVAVLRDAVLRESAVAVPSPSSSELPALGRRLRRLGGLRAFAAFFAAGLAAGFAAAFLAAGFAATFLAARLRHGLLAAGFAATFLAAGFATAFRPASPQHDGLLASPPPWRRALRRPAWRPASQLFFFAAGLAVALAAGSRGRLLRHDLLGHCFFDARGLLRRHGLLRRPASSRCRSFARVFAAVARDPEREDELRVAPERELELRELDDRDDLAAAATARGLVDSTVSDMSGDMSPWVMNDLLLFGLRCTRCRTNRVFSAQFGRRTARGAVGRPSGDRFVVHVVLGRVLVGELCSTTSMRLVDTRR